MLMPFLGNPADSVVAEGKMRRRQLPIHNWGGWRRNRSGNNINKRFLGLKLECGWANILTGCWYHTEPDNQLDGSPQSLCHPTSQKVAVLNYNPCGHNGIICSWKMAFSIVVGKMSLARDFTRDCSLFSHRSWWQMYWLNCMMILQVGIKKTLERVRTRFYCVGQRRDVEQWCKACQICAARKSQPKKHKAPLQIEPATYPLEWIALDILHGPITKNRTWK